MTGNGPEKKPDITGDWTSPEVLNNRLVDDFNIAEENDSPLLEVYREDNRVERALWPTGRQDQDPILVTNPAGELKYIYANIYIGDTYGDIPGIGRDADGEPAEIMQLDPMAELEDRDITIGIDSYDHPIQWDPDVDESRPQNGWKATYRPDQGWSLGFWRDGKHPWDRENPGDWVKPKPDEIELLKIVIDHTYVLVRTPQ